VHLRSRLKIPKFSGKKSQKQTNEEDEECDEQSNMLGLQPWHHLGRECRWLKGERSLAVIKSAKNGGNSS
jgi:hypothetical protein